MKVLFSLLSAGFLKHFEAPIAELASRGHDVTVVIHGDTGLRGAEEQAERLSREHGSISVVRDQVGYDEWQHLNHLVRACEDHLQFLDPIYHETYRARADVRTPPPFRRFVELPGLRSAPARKAVGRALSLVEHNLPVSPAVRAFLEEQRPDLVLLSPYIGLGTVQPAYLHAAQSLGIPAAVCVASWDHLTAKSRMRPLPGLVTVWNETQRREAAELHDVPPEIISVTGAQLFDDWFTWQPRPREEFCAAAGIDPSRPYLLYACFSPFKAAEPEPAFVRTWLERLRASDDPRLAELGVIVRPHPKRLKQWEGVSLDDHENVVLWPRSGQFVTDRRSRADFFDSIHHSVALVGLNTSVMIEAAIIGRPVHTILVPEYWESQLGTLHFKYLMEVGGGILEVADDLDDHLARLAESLEDAGGSDRRRRFVEEFVRPHGLDKPATPIFADAVERLGTTRPRRRSRRADPILRRLLGPLARRVADRYERARQEARARKLAKQAKRTRAEEKARVSAE